MCSAACEVGEVPFLLLLLFLHLDRPALLHILFWECFRDFAEQLTYANILLGGHLVILQTVTFRILICLLFFDLSIF